MGVEDGILLPYARDGRASGQAYVQFTNGEDAKKALSKNREHMGHRYVEIFESSMEDAFRNQYGEDEPKRSNGFGEPSDGNRSFGSRRGRPSPYDRSPSYGRGFGLNGPGSMKRFGGRNDSFIDEFSDGMGRRTGMGPSMGMGGLMGMSSGMGIGYGMGANAGFQVGHMVRMQGIPFNVTESDIAEWFSSVADPVKVDIKYNDDGRPSGNAHVLFAAAEDAKKAMLKNKENMQHRYVELFYDGEVMGQSGISPAGLGMSGSIGAGMGNPVGLGMSGSIGAGMGSPAGLGMSGGIGALPIGAAMGNPGGLGMSGSIGAGMGSPAGLGMSGNMGSGMGRGMGMGFGRGFGGRGGMGMGFGGMPGLGSY